MTSCKSRGKLYLQEIKLTQKIDKEAKRNEQFLRINGGIENYPEIGEKVSSLLVESIKGKLSILNTISGI